MQEILNTQTVLVFEGAEPMFQRVADALEPRGAQAILMRGLPELMQDELDWRCLVVVSTSAVHPADAALVLQRTQDRHLVWVDQPAGAPAWITPRQPANVLPFNFRAADLCRMLTRLAHRLAVQDPPPVRRGGAQRTSGVNLLLASSVPPPVSRINHQIGRQPNQDGRKQLQI